MKSQTIIVAIVILLVVIGGAWYLSGKGGVQAPTPTQTPGITLDQPDKTFEVEGKPFEFNPKELKVKKGDVVKIILKNSQGFHDLSVDGYNVKTKQIQAGESDTIQFRADKAGTFPMFCGVGTHRQQGMEGVLIVEE